VTDDALFSAEEAESPTTRSFPRRRPSHRRRALFRGGGGVTDDALFSAEEAEAE
jgi:hypothetical protein